MGLPDIDEENRRLQESELPDIEEANAQIGQGDLPDIDEENARIAQGELPDIEEENARLHDSELPDIEVENGIIAKKNLATQTQPVVQTAQPTATVDKQKTPAKQNQDAHWQEMDERSRQFNLGDKISAASDAVAEGLKGARDVVGSVANPVLKLIGDAAQGLGNLSAHGVVMPNGIVIGERGELGGNKLTPDELAVKRRNNIGTAVGGAINKGVDTIFPNEPNDNPVTAKIQKVGNEIGGLLRFTIGNAAALGAAEYGPTWNADYDAYIQAGKTPSEAAAWADLGGITNAIFAMALKGIPVGHYVKKMFGWELPENLLKEAIDKAGTLGMKEVKSAMTNILAGQLFKNAVTEAGVLGGVSAAQTAATGAIQQLGTTGEIDAAALGKAALESGFHGAATGATMAALPIAVKIPEARRGAEEPIRTAQEMRAAANASRFTPEQMTTLNMRIPEFVGDDAEMTGRVMDRISEKMADEAINGTPEGKAPIRERLDDPAEMEIEIQKATEELLFEDNAAEVAKSVNTQTLGTKAADRMTQIATAMPRTADKTECLIAGEIGAADPDMDAERVWEVAEYLAAHGETASPDGQPLTKERIAEIEKAMVDDKTGTFPVEQPDGSFKTVNEVEAEAAREERKNGIPETQTSNPETPAPALQMKPVDHSGDWAPVSGKPGVFHTAEFPDVEIALQDAQPGEGTKDDGTPKKIAFIENLPDPATLDEAGQMKLGKFLYEQIGRADKMGIEEVNVGRDDAEAAKYMELFDRYRDTVKSEKFQVRADSVVGLLKKSGLASDVIATEAEFNEKLAASGENGQALVADGKTYGFTDGTNVYLNPAFFSTIRGLNTPIHEFGHLAIIATKNVNRAVYDRALNLIKDTGYWKEVSEHPDYANLPDWKKAEEALTRLIADRGERLEATTPKGIVDEIKQLLVKIWQSFGNSLGLHDLTPEMVEKMTVEDLADAIRAEMLSGREFGARRVEAERMGEQDDLSDMPDFSRGQQQIMLSRGSVNGKETAIAVGYPLTLREARDAKKIESVLQPFVGKEFQQAGETKLVKVSPAFVNEFLQGKYGRSLISGNGNERKRLMRARVGGASVLDDLIATTKLGTPESPKHLNKLFKEGATFYRSQTQFGIAVENGVNVYPCELLVLQTKDGNRYVYDFVKIGNPTLAESDTLDSDTLALVKARMPTAGVGSTGGSIANQSEAGNGDIMLSRGARLVGGRTRVAADQDHGEQTPGGLAAARELADVRRAPVSTLGARRFLSLDISGLEELRKIVSKDVRPAHVARTEAGVARTEGQIAQGNVAIWSDVIGVVDHTDAAAEKANLKAHGFFRNEDSGWCSGQSDAAIKAEANRSEQQLSRQLEALGERRMRGMEPGGQTAERGVFADEVAKVVLAQERMVGGRLGRLQTIGKSVQDAVARMPGMNAADAEWSARRFLDWSYGQPDYSRNMSGRELTAEMFGKWLVMPRAVEQTCPEWANAIEQTIAADPKLADAFRTLADRRLNGDEYLMRKIRKQMSRQTEEALRKINEEKDESIGAGSKWRKFEEMTLCGLHDTFAPVFVRMDYMTRIKIKAMKEAIKAASPADRPALRQQLEIYLGDLGQKLNQLELSRTAYERGTINEGSLYHREMVRLENEAHERWGLKTEDMSLYLDQWRVIETSGRSASFGEDVVQARKALEQMEARLGPEKWRRMQEYGNRFFAIHERELLNDPRAEKMFGKAFIDYLRTQTHYVATERTFSVDEMDAIEMARRALRATGASNVDDVISQMFDYACAKGAGEAIGEKDWTGPMKGSMAAKTEVRGATFKKVDRLQRALRRNQLVLDLREALTFSEVEGVRDLPRTEGAKFPDGTRYGHINYLENGQKRTLIVPRQIADAFKGDPAKANAFSKAVRMIHNTWRALIIDFNPAYRPMNIRRNIASVEKNMPGMRETYWKTGLRATFPGAGAVSDLVFDQMVKRIPATAKLFSDHTYFYYIPQMERICRIIESPSEWQKKYWEAQDANDLGKISEMDADWNLAKEMLRANMFVSIRSAYANEKSTSFAAEALAKKGLRTLEEIDQQLKSRDWKRKSVDRLFYLLKKTQQMTEHDDMMAKGIAYLADRKHFGLVRTSQESGDLVNRRVSIAQGERRGSHANSLKALVPFYNMIEKGVVRHYDAYRTDFGHTLAADAKFVLGSTCSMLMAKGLAQLWMLRNCDNDEEKARKKFGRFYDYAKAYHNAYKNCSDYIRKNYSFTPLWTDGYTSVILGGALTDEEKLLNPIVDYAVGTMAASEGLEQMPSFGSMLLDSTVRSVVPDLQMTGPLVEGMRLAYSVLSGENYEDYFRGSPAFDQKVLDMRFKSLEDFKEYSAVVGGRAWNYFGGRSVLSADVNGVDNGRGTAPKTLEAVLKDIPWISPVINRMVKIQVGSPERDGQAIKARSKEVNQAIEKCAERLLKLRDRDAGWHVGHPKEYEEKLAEWKQTYGLSDHDMKVLRARYLNGLNQMRCIEKMDKHKRKLIEREAKKQGCSKELIYLQLGDR